eukprot:3585240-Rhodomonas_salina.1
MRRANPVSPGNWTLEKFLPKEGTRVPVPEFLPGYPGYLLGRDPTVFRCKPIYPQATHGNISDVLCFVGGRKVSIAN